MLEKSILEKISTNECSDLNLTGKKLGFTDLVNLACAISTNSSITYIDHEIFENFISKNAFEEVKRIKIQKIKEKKEKKEGRFKYEMNYREEADISQKAYLTIASQLRFNNDCSSYNSEMRTLILFICNIIKRNYSLYRLQNPQNEAKSILSENFRNYLDKYCGSPIALGADLGKILFSYSLGLQPIYRFFVNKFHSFTEWKLPTVGIVNRAWVPGGRLLRYNTFELTHSTFDINPVTVFIAPINYFWRNVGKLIGATLGSVLALALLPVAVSIASYKTYKAKKALQNSILSLKTEADDLTRKLVNNIPEDIVKSPNIYAFYQRITQESKPDIVAALVNQLEMLLTEANVNYYAFGQIFRDEMQFELAYQVFSKVSPFDENYLDAVYEAGSIALFKMNKPAEAKQLFKEGLKVALHEKDDEYAEHFRELLNSLFEKDEIIDEKSPLLNMTNKNEITHHWQRQLAAEGYEEIRQRHIDKFTQSEEQRLLKTLPRML